MSEERDPEVLQLFIEETAESLGRVDSLLVAAEAGDAPADMMSRLFRDLHTIKGTAGFLALSTIAKLAHAAEDLLSKLRDGELAPTKAHYAALLETSDALRRMVDVVANSGDEGDFAIEPLVARLRGEQGSAPATGQNVQNVQNDVLTAAPAEPPPPPEPPTPAEATPAAATSAEHAPVQKESADGTVRVNVGVLDRLMSLMGELVLARNQITSLLKKEDQVAGQEACQRLSLVTGELQETVMKARMQPVSRVFEKLPRLVRDLCQQTGKQVHCEIDGNATEIDKALVEAVRDPLLHLVRNAIDHGCEKPEARIAAGKSPTGLLRVAATHDGGMVCIEVQDDGRGIDPQKLRELAKKRKLITSDEADRLSDREALDLIFRPGFSTAERVTDISGRGVGMDVVRTHVERAGGQIEIETTNGRGTTFRLKMPLTLAIVPALLVEQSGQRFAVPRHAVSELVFLDDEQARTELQTVRGAPIARLRGEVLPLVRVGEALQMAPGQPPSGVTLVVMGTGQGRYALAVDDIKDTEEIVIKPLTGALKRLRCYSGAAVLGDGTIALVLDAAGLSALAGIDAASQREARAEAAHTFAGPSAAPFLVFTAGDNAQCAVPLSRVARLEQLSASAVERVANREVVQYRGALLPLLRPEQHLPIGEAPLSEELHLVVLDAQPPLALVARAIVDVVQIELNAGLMGRARPLTQGEAIAFGKATLLLDTRALQAALADAQPERMAVLVVGAQGETSAFLREQGVEVIEADAAQARELARTSARAVVADAQSPLLAELRREYPLLPLLATAEEPSAQSAARARTAGAWACIARDRKDELLAQLQAWGVPASAAPANQSRAA